MHIDQVFAALASPARRRILAFLSSAQLTTSELADRFSMTAPAVSRHLSVLENAGLVSSERHGQRVLYRINPDHLVNTLADFAFEICPVARSLKRQARAANVRREKT